MNDDAELLERIRNGATDDFAGIVRRHQARVFAILHRYERDAHKVEDLAQETFVKAWRALGQFDGRAPFEHWLSRIAARVALDHLRREKRRQNEVGLAELGDDALDWLRAMRTKRVSWTVVRLRNCSTWQCANFRRSIALSSRCRKLKAAA